MGASLDSSEATRARSAAKRAYLAEHEDRLAWIMGSSRSGSTWLVKMLGELGGTATVDDPHLGHHLGVWRPVALAWATASERPELNDLRALKREEPNYFFSDAHRDAWLPALRDLILSRFAVHLDPDEIAAGRRPSVIVKEPGSHSADLIFEAVPGSRLIFLLRDGRDVIDSWLDAYRPGSWAIEGGAYPVASSGRMALIEWLSSVWAFRTRAVAAAFAGRRADRRILVRYEDLLENPSDELARIVSMLDLECHPSEIERATGRHDFDALSPRERGSLRAVRAANPGGWRENLSAAEQRVMHEIMGSELSAFGYLPRGGRAAA